MAREALSADLVGNIYDAALDDERWPQFAQIVATAAGTNGTAVWIVDSGQILDFSATTDLLPTQAPYLAHYGKLDPWQRGLLAGGWGQVKLGAETFPERELVKTEFYNDFARPNGILRPMGAMMRLGRGSFATVAANRPDNKKVFDEHDKPRLERLIPHLRRALQLRVMHRTRQAGGQVHAAALDGLAFGVVICDAFGQILAANAAATAMANAGAGITLGGRRKGLDAIVPVEARALDALIRDAAHGGPGGIVRLTGRGGAAELVALVTPLPRQPAGDKMAQPGHALVTLRSLSDSPSFSADTLVALFGLSPAQAAIALAIFDGKSPDTIAADRGVTISTLRTHLAQIFARTGAADQRELVRLLGMLPPVQMRANRTTGPG